jgi:hypothetical protein
VTLFVGIRLCPVANATADVAERFADHKNPTLNGPPLTAGAFRLFQTNPGPELNTKLPWAKADNPLKVAAAVTRAISLFMCVS